MTYFWRLAALAFVFALAPGALAADLTGKVVEVLDGDTVDVLTSVKEVVRVRLAGIDAPEKKQAFGTASKQTLSQLVFRSEVVVEWHKKDRYGRLLGKVMVDGVDANLKMVQAGMAWHYKKYIKEQPSVDQLTYAEAENSARANHAGLWRDAQPTPPWMFRRPHAVALGLNELASAAHKSDDINTVVVCVRGPITILPALAPERFCETFDVLPAQAQRHL